MTMLVERPLLSYLARAAMVAAPMSWLLSCAHEAPYRPGASEASAPAPAASSAGEPKASRWEHFGELASMKSLAAQFPSRGHGTGEWNAQLRGNNEAVQAIDGVRPSKPMPKGALLVQLHTDRNHGGAVEGFFMEKREAGWFPEGGDWEYGVLGADGMLQSRGKLTFCARCHAEAPADFVFPRPAAR